MEKIKKEKIKQILKEFFSKADVADFYFIKGLKEFSNSILIKSKKVDPEKLPEANLILKKELGDPAIELLSWFDNVGGFIPKKNVYKIPFLSTSEIKEINPWRICPIGEHWVRRHYRQKKHLEDVDGYCRKNKSKKDQLKGDEIDLISNHLFVPIHRLLFVFRGFISTYKESQSSVELQLLGQIIKGKKRFNSHQNYSKAKRAWGRYC